jgi:hypothetical protein
MLGEPNLRSSIFKDYKHTAYAVKDKHIAIP